ncbi:RHS repeat-associated core domain-containing protein, partial [Janthinobacterium sp. UMAB-60]|uniref:RHS repeat-associated core domain-containing protein n=1 Tax=Janthinobacterium sp. UMAB-60 TaxID=1365365 RepID=UPI00214B5743
MTLAPQANGATDYTCSSITLGNLKRAFTYDDAGSIVRQTVTTWRYAGAHLVAIDHSQQAERYSHDAQGRLPGQYADQETGLYYNDQRYYDPAQGRYLTPDPLGL